MINNSKCYRSLKQQYQQNMNRIKNQTTKQKPIIAQPRGSKPGSPPIPYIQTEPDDTDNVALDSMQYRDTNPNCEDDEPKYFLNSRSKDQEPFDDVPQLIPKTKKTKLKQSHLIQGSTEQSAFKKTPISSTSKPLLKNSSPIKSKGNKQSGNIKLSSPTAKNKSKIKQKKVLMQQESEQRAGIHSGQKRSNQTTSQRVIKHKFSGQTEYDHQIKQSPTRRVFPDPNDQIKEGLRTERLNTLKNEFSENTIKRTIHLQDSNSDEEIIQPKKIMKSPRSPKTANSKARVSHKMLGGYNKKISTKVIIEESKREKNSNHDKKQENQFDKKSNQITGVITSNSALSGGGKGGFIQKSHLDHSKKTLSHDSDMDDTEPSSMPVNKVKTQNHTEKNIFMKQGGGFRVMQHSKLVQAKPIQNPSAKDQPGRRTLVELGPSKEFAERLSNQKLHNSKTLYTSTGQLQHSKSNSQSIFQNNSQKQMPKETRVQAILSNMVPQQTDYVGKKNKIRASEFAGAQKTKTTKNTQMQKNKFLVSKTLYKDHQDILIPPYPQLQPISRQNSYKYAEEKEQEQQSKMPFRSVHIEEKEEFPSPKSQNKQNQNAFAEQQSFALTDAAMANQVARMGRHLGPGIDTVLNPTSPNNQQSSNTFDSVASGNNQDPQQSKFYANKNDNDMPFRPSQDDKVSFQFEDRTQYHFNNTQQQEMMQMPHSQRFSMPSGQKNNHFVEQALKKNISSKSPFHGSRERIRALSINKEEVNQIVKQQFQSLPQQIILQSKANISISATRPGQLNISHQLNNSRGNNSSSRRDRSLTHHIQQSNNANEFNPEEKRHRLDKTNRVRFLEENSNQKEKEMMQPMQMQNHDIQNANYSVTSGDNCSSSRPRELSSLKQMRQQRKVSKSLLKNNAGIVSNQSENNLGQNKELLIENNTINLGNKIQDIQNQLKQLSELSAENRSQGASSRARLRSGSFKRAIGNALVPSEQFQSDNRINPNFSAFTQGGFPPPYQHQRGNSMQTQLMETPQHGIGRSTRLPSHQNTQSDLLATQNNFNSTTKKVMINLSSNQIYDLQSTQMKPYSQAQSNSAQRKQIVAQVQTAVIPRQPEIDISLVTEEKSMLMFEGMNSFDRSYQQNRPTNYQGTGKPPSQHTRISRVNQPALIHQSSPIGGRANSKSLKRQMTKHETMTEKLSREIIQQSSLQIQNQAMESSLISPVPYGTSRMESSLLSGPAGFAGEDMTLVNNQNQPIEAFNLNSGLPDQQNRQRNQTLYDAKSYEQSLQTTPHSHLPGNMRQQSERSLNRKLNSSSISQTRLSRKGNLMFQKDKNRKSGMNINLNNQGLGMNFKQM